MKKLTLSLVFMMIFTLSSFAQSIGHLKFKSVPIDGTLNEYVAKMKQVGFELVETANGTALLSGDFAGYKNCLILVSTLKSVDLVNTISVMFPAHEEWSSLENDYDNLKSMLTIKYGEPAEVVEKFQGYGNPQTDQDKWIKLITDNYTWYATYEIKNGDIQLSLEKTDIGQSFVVLRYFDKINTATIRTAAMEDL